MVFLKRVFPFLTLEGTARYLSEKGRERERIGLPAYAPSKGGRAKKGCPFPSLPRGEVSCIIRAIITKQGRRGDGGSCILSMKKAGVGLKKTPGEKRDALTVFLPFPRYKKKKGRLFLLNLVRKNGREGESRPLL